MIRSIAQTLRAHSAPAATAFALTVLTLAALPAVAQDAPTVDELIAMNLEAKGGLDNIKKVDAVRVTGKMNMAGMEAPFTYEWKKPNLMRIEFTIGGMTGTQAFDGDGGWMIMPFTGKTDPERMNEADTKALEDQVDFWGPLVDTEEKGYTIEYVGEEEIEGTAAHKLKISKEDDVRYLYLDKDYGLEFYQVGKMDVQGQEVEANTSIGDYKEVGGLMISHSMDIEFAGTGQGQNLTFETIELDAEIDDSRFEMPAPAPAEGADEKDAEKGSNG